MCFILPFFLNDYFQMLYYACPTYEYFFLVPNILSMLQPQNAKQIYR
jgi:hypothetical protein